MRITSIYAGTLGLVYLFLSARIIVVRRTQKVSLGDGGNADLLKRIRIHGNFAEYAPIALVFLAVLESLAMPPVLLHSLGSLLLCGRCMHAWALSRSGNGGLLRVVGMVATLTMIGLAAVACLVLGLRH
jgi:uncharacterized protein